MGENGLSVADALALGNGGNRNGNNNDAFGGNGAW